MWKHHLLNNPWSQGRALHGETVSDSYIQTNRMAKMQMSPESSTGRTYSSGKSINTKTEIFPLPLLVYFNCMDKMVLKI